MSGLRNTLRFYGRASRAEFWWFAPVGVLLPFAVYLVSKIALGVDFKTIGGMIAVLVGCLPLFAAGFRRLQDAGTDGAGIFLPVAPVAYFFVSLVLWELGFDAILGGVPVIFAFLIVGIYWLTFPFVFLISAMWIGPVVGHLILPSQPGPNRYGPNLGEVSK